MNNNLEFEDEGHEQYEDGPRSNYGAGYSEKLKANPQTVYTEMDGEWNEDNYTLMNSSGEYVCNLFRQEVYVFTPEELKKILSDAFDEGQTRSLRLTKVQYVENFLNKEK
jgi:20S proteasome alpha/beta subunit